MKKIVSLGIVLLLLGIVVFVGYGYLYPQDIKELNEHLEENKRLIKDHQELYNNIYLAKEKNEYDRKVEELNEKENNIGDTVKELKISFVGDSVMLGAVRELGKMFPNSYSDALTSRSLIAGIGVIEDLKNAGNLADIVVVNLGANGDCYNGCKDKVMDIVGKDRNVFWLTVTDDYKVNINSKLKELAEKYENFHVIDWESLSEGHEDWFYADGIHLPYTGQKAYTEVIYNALVDFYKDKFSLIREKELKEFALSQLNGLEMYGNDLLINVFDLIKDDYSNVKINSDSNYKIKDILNDINSNKDKIKNNVLLAFDSNANLSKGDYEKIIGALEDRKISIIALSSEISNDIKNLGKENVTVLEFIKDEKEDYLSDKKHLKKEINEELAKLIRENFKLEDTTK